MEKCVYYQSKVICTECDSGKEVTQPLVLVNNLLEGASHSTNIEWTFLNKRSFNNFYQGDQNNTAVLKFKYSPPKTSELLHDGQMNKHFNQESSHEYSHHRNPNIKSRTILKSSCQSFPIYNFSLNANIQKTEIVSGEKDRGLWCVYSCSSTCSSNNKKLNSTPEFLGKTCPGTRKSGIYSVFSKGIGSSSTSQQMNQKYDLQRLKRKYNITNYHRGKWLISSKENSSCLWREICKLISTKDLVHCNAKYQGKAKGIIWLYCDFIDSLDVHEILKWKLNIIPQDLSYSIHPHGIIMTII